MIRQLVVRLPQKLPHPAVRQHTPARMRHTVCSSLLCEHLVTLCPASLPATRQQHAAWQLLPRGVKHWRYYCKLSLLCLCRPLAAWTAPQRQRCWQPLGSSAGAAHPCSLRIACPQLPSATRCCFLAPRTEPLQPQLARFVGSSSSALAVLSAVPATPHKALQSAAWLLARHHALGFTVADTTCPV